MNVLDDPDNEDEINTLYYRTLIEMEEWQKILALTMKDETHGLAWGYSRLIAAWMSAPGESQAVCANMFWDALSIAPDVPFYMLGYYSVTELAQRIKGRGMTKTYLELDMENSELLTMKVTDKANVSNRLGNDDSLIFNIYNGQASGSTLMSFNIDYKNIKEYSTFAEGLSKSAADPMKVTFNMQSGLYMCLRAVP